MSRGRPLALLASGLCAAAGLAACGGSQQTSAVTRTRTVVQTVTAPATSAPATATSGRTTAPPSPSGPLTLRDAERILSARGYAPLTEHDWHPDQALKVLLGIRRAAPRAERAFFFAGGRYIGTDTSEPSGTIEVVAQGDRQVTLAYGLYRPGDALCCARGGMRQVTYAWTGTRLAAQGPIPTADPGAQLSRR